MDGETAVPARNRTATVAIAVAAVTLSAFVLVGTGVLVGWIPRGAVPDAPPGSPDASAPTKTPSKVPQKFSGSEPLMPKYSQPAPPQPAPQQTPEVETRPSSPQATPAPAPAPQRRALCEDCGRVIGIANWRSDWEMRVRFDDGSTQTFRFMRRPPFDLGERVRLDDGELLPD